MKKYMLIIVIILVAAGAFTFYKIKQEQVKVDELVSFTENVLEPVDVKGSGQIATQKNVPSSTSTTIDQNSIKDCGEDFDCFIEASKMCIPAKVSHDVTVDFSYEMKSNVDFEIKTVNADKCEVVFTINSSVVSFIDDPSASQETKDQVKDMMVSAQSEINNMLKNKPSNQCTFKNKTLTALLEGIKKSGFHLSMNNDDYKVFDNLSVNNCTGPFILN